MGAISELYRGRISAPTDIKVRADEYGQLVDDAEKLTEAVNAQLSGDAAQAFNELLEIQHSLTSVASEDSYTRGFRDGARLMLDMLNG